MWSEGLLRDTVPSAMGGVAPAGRLEPRPRRVKLLPPSSPSIKALSRGEPNYHSLPSVHTDQPLCSPWSLPRQLAKSPVCLLQPPKAQSSMSTWTDYGSATTTTCLCWAAAWPTGRSCPHCRLSLPAHQVLPVSLPFSPAYSRSPRELLMPIAHFLRPMRTQKRSWM